MEEEYLDRRAQHDAVRLERFEAPRCFDAPDGMHPSFYHIHIAVQHAPTLSELGAKSLPAPELRHNLLDILCAYAFTARVRGCVGAWTTERGSHALVLFKHSRGPVCSATTGRSVRTDPSLRRRC